MERLENKGQKTDISAFFNFSFLFQKIKNKKYKNRIRLFFISLAVTLVCFILSFTAIFENLELKSYDLRFRLRGPVTEPDSNIVVVAIDDQSFLSLNTKWPFPRTYFARLIKNLAQAGARLVIIDVTLTETSFIPHEDTVLARALEEAGNVILAGKVVHEFNRHGILNPYIIKPISLFEEKTLSWGLVNVPEDPDGFVRRYTLSEKRGDEVFYTLAVEALREMEFAQPQDIEEHPDYLHIGNYLIRKYRYNSLLVNYAGPAATLRTYSFASILDDADFELEGDEDTDIFEIHKQSGTFKNKIVFVGASTEELQDNKFTPFFGYGEISQKTPGVEVHATALSTILSRDYIRSFPLPASIFLVLLFSILAGFISQLFSPLKGLALIGAEIIVILIIMIGLFISFRLWAPLIFPIFATLMSYGTCLVHQVLTERREKGRYRKTFEHYVASSVVETMLAKDEIPKFGGERKELTILFSDIRSFTTFSEKHQPEDVVNQLSEYLTEMTNIIFKNNGTLDKFVGDEIMAVFGAPYYFENHAFLACKTAFEMILTLKQIQKRWAAQNLAWFEIGIGVNTGKVIVGNLGSAQLFDYTVIGDEVNLGARLEGANKQYSTTIIISESTYTQVRDKVIVRELDFVQVKGKKKPVKIYELKGIYRIPEPEQEFLINVYSKGLAFYKQKKWYPAIREFNRVLKHFPNDGPSRVYIQRCLDYVNQPPPVDWDGVFVFTSK